MSSNTISEEVVRRENIRTGIINKVTYAESKKLPKEEVHLVQKIHTKGLEKTRSRYLFYIHNYNIPPIINDLEANNIFYNPKVVKICIVGFILVIVIVIILAIRFS